jgi:hypothetical protein
MIVFVFSLEFSLAKRWAGDKGRMFLKSTNRKEGRPDQPNSEAKKNIGINGDGPKNACKMSDMLGKKQKNGIRYYFIKISINAGILSLHY